MQLLILGGTTEATALARSIADRNDLAPVLSFAGRTQNPVPPPIPFRVGGFGGIAGLKTYLLEHRTAAVIDATHPFAAQMSRHAVAACQDLRIPLARLTRPAWCSQDGDRWTAVADIAAAVRELGERPRNVFLTVGGLQLAAFAHAPQHHYVVRTIDPPPAITSLPSHHLILARGPFSEEAEIALMRAEQIHVLVTKNSGGPATAPKLAAARTLAIDVILIDRPEPEPVPTFYTNDKILAWIELHRPTP
jgi:precorrin-6A/cobalt-precorrin-6A reductase